MKALALLLALLVQDPSGGLPAPASKQGKPVVEILSIAPERTSAKNGEAVRVRFELRVPEHWYIYEARKERKEGESYTILRFDGPAEVRGPIEEPAPKEKEVAGEKVRYHEGTVSVTFPIALKGTKPGPVEVRGVLDYQICKDVCVYNRTPFAFTLESLGGEDRSEFDEYGFFGLILLGIVGGLVSLVMPCTYPLIPITLTYFVKQAAGSRRHGMTLSSVYSAGIIITFTGLGFLLTVLLGKGGAREFAANPWVNIVVGALFLWFTGSLFGWYEIQLPFGLGSKLAGGQRKGVGGAFILGLLFSVVTFTCTIPIAATILGVAAGQHRLAAVFAMLAYSATMALPFFLMGVFPGMIKEIPRSGGWLTTVKVSMAFVELGLAVFYFSKADQSWEIGILGRAVVIGLWLACCLAVAGYLLKLFRSPPTFVRCAFAALFLAFGGYVAYGITGKSLGMLEIIVPPPSIHNTTLPEALKEAKEKNRPLFVEFTGVT